MSLQLDYSNEQDKIDIPESLIEKLQELLRFAGEAEGMRDGEVTLTFVDDESIHALNREYRGIDRPTDVLSFAMQDEGTEELDIIFEV